jgi:HEAT repeat protein
VRASSKTPLPLTAGEEVVVKTLQHLLVTGSDEQKEQVAFAFLTLRVPGAQPELLDCVRKEPFDIARTCAWALGEAHDPANVDRLVAMLADPAIRTEWDEERHRQKPLVDERVTSVQHAVSSFGDAAVPALASLVRSDNPVARELAVQSLALISTEAAAEAVLPALRDPDQLLRFWAITAIEPHPRYWPELKPLLDDPEKDVREEAKNAMAGQAEFSPKQPK